MARITVNSENFDEYIGRAKPLLVEYHAPWCVYCRRISPAVKALAEKYEEQLDVIEIDIDASPELADKNGVEVVPTFVFIKNGENLGSIIAPDSKSVLESFIAERIG